MRSDERRWGRGEKQLRILRLAALAQGDNQVLFGAGKVSCFPRSQKRDLGHPRSCGAMNLQGRSASTTWCSSLVGRNYAKD